MSRTPRFTPKRPARLVHLLLGWRNALLPAALALAASLAAGACVSQAPPSPSEDIDPSHRLLWMDSEKTDLMFLPERVLNEKELAALPLNQVDREALLSRVKDYPLRVEEFNRQFPRRELSICYPLPATSEQKLGEGPPADFKKLFGERELAVRAKVTAIVPGWSTWVKRVVTMVYIRVEETLASGKSAIKPGATLIFSEPHGSILIGDQRVCTDWQPGLYASSVGDELVILGTRLRQDSDYLAYGHVYPVAKGRVSTHALVPSGIGSSISLDELRRLAKAGGAR